MPGDLVNRAIFVECHKRSIQTYDLRKESTHRKIQKILPQQREKIPRNISSSLCYSRSSSWCCCCCCINVACVALIFSRSNCYQLKAGRCLQMHNVLLPLVNMERGRHTEFYHQDAFLPSKWCGPSRSWRPCSSVTSPRWFSSSASASK